MKLKGSCHCGSVRFEFTTLHPYPYNICYCSICRKTAGGGGFSINIKGDSNSLKIEGGEFVHFYRAKIQNPEDSTSKISPAKRHFCKNCASYLWVSDDRWPDSIYPFASAIDSNLPVPPSRTHLMLEFKAPWVEKYNASENDKNFQRYPDEGIKEWHERLSLVENI